MRETQLGIAAGTVSAPTETGRTLLRDLFVSMRPQQWTKNLFILAPLLFSKNLGELIALKYAILAFVCFCLASSAVYVFNDIRDARHDNLHPVKATRPISAGRLPVSTAWIGMVVLLASSLSISWTMGANMFPFVSAYLALMAAYCLYLKRVIVLDAMCIAGGFVLRVTGGAAAISVKPSNWLIVCTFLLALFLAFAKRRQELQSLASAAGHREVLGGYTLAFLEQVNTVLLASLVVCYALYTVAPETVDRSGTDLLIYGTLFVLYGLFRYLSLIQDSRKGGDPGKLLISDRPLVITVLIWALYNSAVIYRAEIATSWQRLF